MSLLIKEGDYIKKLELEEIIFFTKHENKVIAHTDSDEIKINSTLYHISEMTKNTGSFLRSHKSYIININLITDISRFSQRTYNVRFKNTKKCAYITDKNFKILTSNLDYI